MSITERQTEILKAIIEEYIKMAEPVSSKALAGQRGFDIGAPMIRKEMNQLEKEGYLASPHTSAGRIPTDQAYRLYIQKQLNSEPAKKDLKLTSIGAGLTPKESEKVKNSLGKKWPDEQALLKEISRLASEISSELSFAGTADGGNAYTFGFSNLSHEPEFQIFENMNNLMHFMDNIDSHFEQLWQKVLFEDLNVFIGEENPIKEINEFTLITGKYQLPQGEEGFVSIIGPKRMNYKRNMALVEYISECINKKLEVKK